MPCHCSTIAVLKNDIEVINKSIIKLKEIKGDSNQISKDIEEAANLVNSNVDITNRYVLVNKLKDINDGEESNLSHIIHDYEKYKLNLVKRKAELIVSDELYHQAEKLKNINNTNK